MDAFINVKIGTYRAEEHRNVRKIILYSLFSLEESLVKQCYGSNTIVEKITLFLPLISLKKKSR